MTTKKLTRQILRDRDIEKLKSNQYRKPTQSAQTAAASPPKSAGMSNEEFTKIVDASVKKIMQKYQEKPSKAPEPAATPKISQQERREERHKFTLATYKLCRPYMVEAAQATTDRLLSAACSSLASILRFEVSIFITDRYSELLAGITGSKQGCFIVPNGQQDGAQYDIWIDMSEIHQFSSALRLDLFEVLKCAICHEVGHLRCGCTPKALTKAARLGVEAMAWASAKNLYQQHCNRDLRTFAAVQNLAIQTYI